MIPRPNFSLPFIGFVFCKATAPTVQVLKSAYRSPLPQRRSLHSMIGHTVAPLLVALIVMLLKTPLPAHAQDETSACDVVRYLMERQITPYDLTLGGGILHPGVSQRSTFSTNYYADTWSLNVLRRRNAIGLVEDEGLRITFADATVPLEFAVFNGMDRIPEMDGRSGYRAVEAGTTYTYRLPRDGIYTVVVRRQDVRQTSAGRYSIAAAYNAGDEITVPNLRNNTTRRMLDTPPSLVQGRTVIPAGTAQFFVHPGSVSSVATPAETAAQVRFGAAGSYGILVGNQPEVVMLIGGDLAVSAAGGRKFYLDDYGYAVDVLDATFSNVVDSNGTRFRLNWEIIQGVWITRECAGFRLQDGRTFTGIIVPSQRDVTFQGNLDQFMIRLVSPTVAGQAASHQMTMNWFGIAPDSEMQLRDGIFRAQLIGDRQIELESTLVDMRRDDVGSELTENTPLTVQLADRLAVLRLDWINLRQFSLTGSVLTFDFMDAPRSRTTRSAADLLRLDAVQDVIQIVYKDRADGTPGEQRLMLPGAESYLEILTPAGLPAFDGRALPGEPGFGARALNNLGGECYPINTLQPEANCPANGFPNPANGNLWYAVTDHIAYGGSIDLALTRSYNSRMSAANGPFGYGWTTTFMLDYAIPYDTALNARVVEDGTFGAFPVGLDLTWAPRGVVTLVASSGSRHVFVTESNTFDGGTLTALTMPGWTLSRADVRDRWSLRQDSGLTYEFDRAGRLTSYGYPGQTITVEYPRPALNGASDLGEMTPVIITDAADLRRLELYYNGDHHIIRSVLRDMTQVDDLTAVDLSICNEEVNCYETRYIYENDYLTAVIYADGSRAAYTYDEHGKLSYHDDPRAPIASRMAYTYGENDQLAIHTIRADETAVLWREVSPPRINQDDQTRSVDVVDEYNNRRTYTYAWQPGSLKAVGSSFTLLRETSPLRDVTAFETLPIEYEWANGLLMRRLSRLLTEDTGRNSLTYEYTGYQVARVRGGYPGFSATYSTTPDDANSPVRYLPQLLSFSDNSTQSFTYDARGWIETMTDRTGGAYRYVWDSDHRLASLITLSDSTAEDFTYNAVGLIASVTRHRIEDDSASQYTVRYQYDGLGRLTRVDDPLTGRYTLDYRLMMADNGKPYMQIELIDATNTVTTTRFDSRGLVVEKQIAPSGSDEYLRRTSYAYDEFKRLVEETRWLAQQSEDGTAEPLTTRYSYTPIAVLPALPGDPGAADRVINGYAVARTDAYGRTRRFTYDALNRVRQVQNEQNLITRYDYDTPAVEGITNSLRIIQRDIRANALVARVEYVFDLRWQLRTVTRITDNPENPEVWEFFYEGDTTRLQALRARPAGVIEQNWGPSIRGRPNTVTRVPVPLPLNSGHTLPSSTLTATYDFRGRPLSITMANRQQTHVVYCPLPAGGEKIAYSTDSDLSCDSDVQAVYYDAQGRITRLDDASGSRTFTYTPFAGGWRVGVTFGADTWELVYNGAGDLIRWTDEHGFTREYRYDTLGRLRRISVANQPEASFTFEYNSADLLISALDDIGRGTRYAYDELGRLIVEQDARTANATVFSYNSDGTLATIISPLGNTTTYLYDDGRNPDRLTAIIEPTGSTAQFQWDDANNRLIYVDPRGNRTVYYYDSADMLWRVDDALGRSHEFLYDGYGNLTQWRQAQPVNGTAARNMVIQRTPSSLRLTEQSQNNWERLFDLNASGQITALMGGDLNFAYDPLGRLTQVASDDLSWSLTYETGQPVLTYRDSSGLTRTMAFDALNRLVLDTVETTDQDPAVTSYVYQQGRGAEVDLAVTDTATRVYTFSSGDDASRPPTVFIRAPGQRTSVLYNADGLVIEVTTEVCVDPLSAETADPLRPDDCVRAGGAGQVWRTTERIVYDVQGRPARSIDQEQNIRTFAYDDAGNLTAYQDIDGKTFSYVYDVLNRLESITGPTGIRILLRYDNLDRVSGICRDRAETRRNYDDCVQAGGQIETYAYDALGRIIRQNYTTISGDTTVNYAYDARSFSWGTGNDPGVVIEYADDGTGRVQNVKVGTLNYELYFGIRNQLEQASPLLTFAYDSYGRLMKTHAGDNQLDYTYAAADQGYLVTDAASGTALSFLLDAHGFLDVIGPDRLDYFLNPDGRILVAQINQENGELVEIRLNRRSEPQTIIYSQSNLFLDYVLDAAGQIQRQSIIGFPQFFADGIGGYIVVVGYDNDGRPLTVRVTDRDSGALLYLTTLTYDSVGQRITENQQYRDGTQITISYQYEAGNQLVRRDITFSRAVTDVLNGSPALLLLLVVAWFMRTPKHRQLPLLVLSSAFLMAVTLSLSGAQQTSETISQLLSYDTAGNLIGIEVDNVDEPIECVRYGYDSANRLIQVTQGEETQQYSYDVYNRLEMVGNRRLIYHGDTSTLLAAVDAAGSVQYYGQTSDLPTWFQSNGEQTTWLINDGQRSILAADTTEGLSGAIWLFDPFGRYLSLESPVEAGSIDPCLSLALPENLLALPPLQMREPLMIWDAVSNLYFYQGRAYSPQLGRFLQRDPLGPDAFGTVYNFPTRHSEPPRRVQPPAYMEGLYRLRDALSLIRATENLSATDVLSEHLPAVMPQQIEPLIGLLDRTAQPAQQRLARQIDLPEWMDSHYNLPGAYVDASGALRLFSDTAPAQGGLRSPFVLTSAELDTGKTGLPSLSAPPDRLQRLYQQAQPSDQLFMQYIPDQWQPKLPSVVTMWARPDDGLRVGYTPATIWEWLPQTLRTPEHGATVFDIARTLDAMATRSSSWWIDQALGGALPTLPPYPVVSSDDWLASWFTNDTLGIAETLAARWPDLEQGTVPVYALGVNLNR